jgi:hypothetical protein
MNFDGLLRPLRNADFADIAKSNNIGWRIFTFLCVGVVAAFVTLRKNGRIVGRREVLVGLAVNLDT